MAKRKVHPTPEAADAVAVLGQHIRLGRHERGWSAADLATRVGCSAPTITVIEAGTPGTAIGTVLTAASLVGVRLFGMERHELARTRQTGAERVALIPSRTYRPRDRDRVPDF